LVLTSQPTANVTITLSYGNQISTNTNTLIFTTNNWNIPQVVTVNAINDTFTEGEHSAVISHTVTSGDSNYNGLTIPPLTVTITDNDTGSTGRDHLIGSPGNDTLNASPGRDTLTGSGGNDTFVYNRLTDAGDIITDFTPGEDLLNMTGVLRSIGFSGADPLGRGYFTFSQSGTGTLLNIDPDGTLGSARPRAFVLLENVTVAAMNNPNNFIF
jgi:Ca2+-binding RTX toxin-like protein